MTYVIKRAGKRKAEEFTQDKLHTSVRSACLSVRSPEGEAETIAARVGDTVLHWINTKPSVTSHDIRLVAARALESFHPEAAYLYQNHELVV